MHKHEEAEDSAQHQVKLYKLLRACPLLAIEEYCHLQHHSMRSRQTKPTHGIMMLYKHDLNPKPGTQHTGGLSHSVQHRVIADPECRPRLS